MKTVQKKLNPDGADAKWKWCTLASLPIVLLSIMPQMYLWAVRGTQWQGAYTILQGDELLYSAYVNALIDGRPRRTDPTAGQDDHPEAPLGESLFSIQFIPPYVIAWSARATGVSASTAFVAVLGVGGLLSTLSLFWLLASVTGNIRVAAVGVVVILCLGALAGGQGLIGSLLKPDIRFLGMPFLRRYEPAVPFPFFFVLCGLIWQALTGATMRGAIVRALFAGLTLAVLIFSYFYLWTAAAAWLACVACLWLAMRSTGRRLAILVFIVASGPVILALGLYGYLLSDFSSSLDKAHVLTFTHSPDLLRIPEIIGTFILIVLVLAVRRGKVSRSEPLAIFAGSFALLPFLVFNQQIITGRSLQPYHYEVFIANYVVLVGLVTVVRFLQPVISRRTASLIFVTCLTFGAMEVILPSPVLSVNDVKHDEMVPVLLHLKELANRDGTWDGLRNHGRTPALVFSPQFGVIRLLPTWAPQGSLLATGSAVFQSLPQEVRKEWLYMHLYYCGKNAEYFRELLNERIDDPFLTYYAKSTIFGPERVLLFLGWNSQLVTQNEINQEAKSYDAFANSFSRQEAVKRPITYVVTLSNEKFDFSHIDLWYERETHERIGVYDLYRVKPRD
jgi:hypothetical protein